MAGRRAHSRFSEFVDRTRLPRRGWILANRLHSSSRFRVRRIMIIARVGVPSWLGLVRGVRYRDRLLRLIWPLVTETEPAPHCGAD